MTDQFAGLPIDKLISGPLTAACKAQTMMAKATGSIKTVQFNFERAVGDAGDNGKAKTEKVPMNVPLLSIPQIPTLAIDTVEVTFDMEVKSSASSNSSVGSVTDHDSKNQIGMGFISIRQREKS